MNLRQRHIEATEPSENDTADQPPAGVRADHPSPEASDDPAGPGVAPGVGSEPDAVLTRHADAAVASNGQPLLSVGVAPLAGLVIAGFALGVAQLLSGFSSTWRSPVLDVGDRLVDAAPPFVKEFAIETFGTNDKPALLAGIGAVLAVYAMAIVGWVGFRKRFGVGIGGVALFGVIGAWAAHSRRGADGSLSLTIPAILGTLAAIVAMWFVRRGAVAERRSHDSRSAVEGSIAAGDRRHFLAGSGAVLGGLGVTAVVAGASGSKLSDRFSAADDRAAVQLPGAGPVDTTGTTAATDMAVDDVPGISSFITPNNDFYRIDTALSVPQLTTAEFSLKVHGMVDNEINLSWDDLLNRDLIEREITICCVSNPVQGPYIGNAKWLGVPLKPLLEEAGVDPNADQIVPRSVDGFAAGFPTTIAMDGRDAMVAVGMNGEPLPLEHGFPARLIVPGLYGYVSATKWLTELELTTFADFESYWVPRGWAVEGPVKTMCRIDTPKRRTTVDAGMVPIAGVAWAQHTGIEKVEVSVDGGEWHVAELGRVPSTDTWVQWLYQWDATKGPHEIKARATDKSGETQTEREQDVLPDGATGYPTVSVDIR